jgi:hypothetical protein
MAGLPLGEEEGDATKRDASSETAANTRLVTAAAQLS